MKTLGKVWIFYQAKKNKQTEALDLAQAQIYLLSLKKSDVDGCFLWTPGWESWQLVDKFIDTDQKYFVMTHPPRPMDNFVAENPENTSTPLSTGRSEIKDSIYDDEEGKTLTTTQAQQTSTQIDSSLIHDSPTLTSINDSQTVTEVTSSSAVLTADHFEKSFTNVKLENDFLGADDFYSPDFKGEDLSIRKLSKIKNTELGPLSFRTDKRKKERHELKIEILIISKNGHTFRSFSKNISLSGTLLGSAAPSDFLSSVLDIVVINKFQSVPSKSRVAIKGKIVGDPSDPRRIAFERVNEDQSHRLADLLNEYINQQNFKKAK